MIPLLAFIARIGHAGSNLPLVHLREFRMD